jgi:beta-ribofuranosylaminobenzene 5'-phosphate synthase
MTAAVHVRAPCRLHFGMFSFGHADRAEFGGVGVMIEPPSVDVVISSSDGFSACGLLGNRVSQFVTEVTRRWRLESLPKCCIEAHSPAEHSGLGVGTQLGLAVAAGLRQFLGLSELPIETLTANAGRGGRSAVGTHGFERGGLIVDAGKFRNERLGKIFQRVEIPADWRFVLVRPNNLQGLAGAQEAETFAALPPVPVSVTCELWQIATEQIVPALISADCLGFGAAVHRFGRLAGECFAAAQGGPFATPAIERLVTAIRDYGVAGVGQSSWGPTVFAIVPTENDAVCLVKWLHGQSMARDSQITVAKPNNSGAFIGGHSRVS